MYGYISDLNEDMRTVYGFNNLNGHKDACIQQFKCRPGCIYKNILSELKRSDK